MMETEDLTEIPLPVDPSLNAPETETLLEKEKSEEVAREGDNLEKNESKKENNDLNETGEGDSSSHMRSEESGGSRVPLKIGDMELQIETDVLENILKKASNNEGSVEDLLADHVLKGFAEAIRRKAENVSNLEKILESKILHEELENDRGKIPQKGVAFEPEETKAKQCTNDPGNLKDQIPTAPMVGDQQPAKLVAGMASNLAKNDTNEMNSRKTKGNVLGNREGTSIDHRNMAKSDAPNQSGKGTLPVRENAAMAKMNAGNLKQPLASNGAWGNQGGKNVWNGGTSTQAGKNVGNQQDQRMKGGNEGSQKWTGNKGPNMAPNDKQQHNRPQGIRQNIQQQPADTFQQGHRGEGAQGGWNKQREEKKKGKEKVEGQFGVEKKNGRDKEGGQFVDPLSKAREEFSTGKSPMDLENLEKNTMRRGSNKEGVESEDENEGMKDVAERVVRDMKEWCDVRRIQRVIIESDDPAWVNEDMGSQDRSWIRQTCRRKVNCVAGALADRYMGRCLGFQRLPQEFCHMMALEGLPHFVFSPGLDVA
nr:uncharacterized protein LOC109147873 [Ipomoea batatas]